MSRINGAGQPSVDEILASIRASIAEEEQPRTAPVRSEQFRVQQPDTGNGDGHEFDLPNIFKPSLQVAPEKHTKLFGRLADALLGANGEGSSEFNGSRRIDLDAPPVNEPIVPAAASAPVVEQPSAPAAAAAPSHDIQRVMVPFRDTRMSALGGGSAPSLGGPASSTPVTTPAPAPVVAQAPAAPVAPEPLAKGQWARPEPVTPVQPSSSELSRSSGFGAVVPERQSHGMNGHGLNGHGLNGHGMNGASDAHDAYNGHDSSMDRNGSNNWSHQTAITPPAPPPQLAPRPPVAAAPDTQHDHGPAGVEDTAAQLLRPMLRQWLSENMPKIVESALRSEAADTVRPIPGKPPGRD